MSEKLRDRIKQGAPFQSSAQAALLNLWVASYHMRQKAEEVCNRRGISLNHYNILRILKGGPEEGYSRADIIGRMIDKGSDVTRLIDRMEKIGLVMRKKCKEDRRRSMHFITDRGRELLVAMAPEIVSIHELFHQRVSDSDLAHLTRICEGIYQES
jgi:DNA-binding MarR family transcriptional regulator